MRCLALVLCLSAGPLAAFEPLTVEDCRATWRAIGEMLPQRERGAGSARDEFLAVSHRVSADGWCRLSGADPALDGAQFATLDWRAEGLADALAGGDFPLAVQIRIDDLRPEDTTPPSRTDFVPPPPVDVSATLRRLPETRQLIIEELRLTSPAGDDLRVTAVFDRVDLSSLAMAQMSMGSVSLRQVNARARLNGWVESQIVPTLDVDIRGDPAAIRQAARDAVADLPDALFTPDAKDNLTAFAASLPAPRGDLELSFASDTGVGALQLVMFGTSAAMSVIEPAPGPGDDMAERAAIMLGGARIDAIWAPDPDQTE